MVFKNSEACDEALVRPNVQPRTTPEKSRGIKLENCSIATIMPNKPTSNINIDYRGTNNNDGTRQHQQGNLLSREPNSSHPNRLPESETVSPPSLAAETNVAGNMASQPATSSTGNQRRRGRPLGSKNKTGPDKIIQKKSNSNRKPKSPTRPWTMEEELQLIEYWERNIETYRLMKDAKFATKAVEYLNKAFEGKDNFRPFQASTVANKLGYLRRTFTTVSDKYSASGYGQEFADNRSMRQRACTEFTHFERLEEFLVDQTNITQIVQGQSGGNSFRGTQPQQSAAASQNLQPENEESNLVAVEEGTAEEGATNDSIIDLIDNVQHRTSALESGPKPNRRHSDSDVIGVRRRSLQQRDELGRRCRAEAGGGSESISKSRSKSNRIDMLQTSLRKEEDLEERAQQNQEATLNAIRDRTDMKRQELEILRERLNLEKEKAIKDSKLLRAEKLMQAIEVFHRVGKSDKVDDLVAQLNKCFEE